MSDTWPDRLDELEPIGSDADVVDELRPVDADEVPSQPHVSDDIEVDPVDSWEQTQAVGGEFDDHDR